MISFSAASEKWNRFKKCEKNVKLFQITSLWDGEKIFI